MTVTDERLKNVDFTSVYAVNVQSIIVQEGSSIHEPEDLAGNRIDAKKTDGPVQKIIDEKYE